MFEIDRYGVRFPLPNICDGVGYWIAPNGFSARGRFLFRPAIRITELERASIQHIDNTCRMRMHRLSFTRLDSILEDAHPIIFEQDLIKLRRGSDWILCENSRADGREENEDYY